MKLQGETVLEGFGIAKTANGKDRVVTREFRDVTAARALLVELISKSATPGLEPSFCAIEFADAETGHLRLRPVSTTCWTSAEYSDRDACTASLFPF